MYNVLKGRLIELRLCLLAAALILTVIGIATIYAVGNPAESSPANRPGDVADLWKKQLAYAVISLLGFIAVNLINYRRLGAISLWIYAFLLVLLGIVLIGRYVINLPFIPEINGAHRWIRFKIAGRQLPAIQPSELCKLGYVLALAWYLRYRSNYRNFSALIGPFILTLLPMVLILLEPDLGTVILMMPILFTMLFIAGAKVRHLLIIVLMAILVSPLLWHKMKPYQRTRISSVLLQNSWIRQKAEQNLALGKILVGGQFNTKKWKNDWGYHLIRSKYAVASGGMKGFGFRKGPFVKYDFLPYRYNDFIFAIIAQQWGFWGCIGLLMLYVIIIGCGLEIAANNTDPFGKLLAIVSYGGSSLLVSMISIGLLNNVGRCRPFTLARKT